MVNSSLLFINLKDSFFVKELSRQVKFINDYIMRYFIFLTILLQSNFMKSQTCIVLKKTDNGFIIGSDTRVVNKIKNSQSGQIETNFTSMKKIHYSGKFGFGIAGYMAKDAFDFAKKACETENDLIKIYTKYRDLFGSFLTERIKLLKSEMPSELNSLREGVAGAVLFGFHNEVPMIINVEIILKENLDINFSAKEILNENVVAIGYVRELYAEGLVNSDQSWKDGDVEGIVKLIKESKRHHPIEVGGDIDFIEIKGKSFKEFTISGFLD